jgi:hypothetical protein
MYWFVRLDLALEEGDQAEAAEAADALRALGIDIRLDMSRSPEREREAAHA